MYTSLQHIVFQQMKLSQISVTSTFCRADNRSKHLSFLSSRSTYITVLNTICKRTMNMFLFTFFKNQQSQNHSLIIFAFLEYFS